MRHRIKDRETPKQGPGGKRAAKQSDQNEAKDYRYETWSLEFSWHVEMMSRQKEEWTWKQ